MNKIAKIRRVVLILSPVAFVADFLFLISLKEPVNPLVKNTGLTFALLCMMVFLASLVDTVIDSIRKPSIRKPVEEKEQLGIIYRTTLELIIRKVFAVLIIASAVPGLAFGPLFVPVALFVGIYIFFRRRYFVAFDIFIILIGILLYFQGLPLFGPAVWELLKLSVVSTSAPNLVIVFLLSKNLILAAGLLFVVSGILSQFKNFMTSSKRGVIILFLSVIIAGSSVLAPLLRPIYLSEKPSAWGYSGRLVAFQITRDNADLTVDTRAKTWTYTLTATNHLNESASILKLDGVRPKTRLFGFLQLFSEAVTIAPPFSKQIEVSGARRDMAKIVVAGGATTTIKIISSEPLYSLVLTDNNRCENSLSFVAFGQPR